jgi:hypothetical protein
MITIDKMLRAVITLRVLAPPSYANFAKVGIGGPGMPQRLSDTAGFLPQEGYPNHHGRKERR